MDFELDKTYGLEFARLEPHEQQYAREHMGPNFPVSVPVDELYVFEDAFRRKARQAEDAIDMLREERLLGSQSTNAFALRGLTAALNASLADISRYRTERRQRRFGEMGEEETTPPDDVS